TEVMARITKIPLVCITQTCWHPAGKPISWWNEQQGAEPPRVTPVVSSVLERYGAEPIGRMEDLNRGDLTLIPSFPEFDPIDDDRAHFTGPLSWASSAEVAPDIDVGPRAASSRPLILVYTGKLHDSAGDSGILILERAVEALGNTEFDVVISIGLGQDIDLRAYAQPNIRVHHWVPMNRLLRRCSLVIHHGGHGSCMAAIQAGVPSLVIPTFQEREFNARQLRALGLGDFITPDDLTPARLVQKIRACIDDPAISDDLRRWRGEIVRRRYGGADSAARRIEALGP
ncbi:MAG TPA: nucleotide disphospho-sugar-binding domain-containing protein, partial [Candidatus Nanopelagicales bacterium]|nr:nucleotide disphospho-sugar-binding domain-containing protein [Candidatus Nanopelagicales bacterium]